MNSMIHNNATNLILGLTIVLPASASKVSVTVAQERDLPFTQLTIDANPPGQPWYKMVGDISGDDRSDIVLSPAELMDEMYKVSWYAAPADRGSENWKEYVIIESIECVIHALGVGELDGDGDIDVAMAEMHQGEDPDEVCILLNSNNGSSWRKQVLSERGSHDIVVGDIDNDGDLDIIGANRGDVHPLELWKNGTRP